MIEANSTSVHASKSLHATRSFHMPVMLRMREWRPRVASQIRACPVFGALGTSIKRGRKVYH
jgi:hypothetical protein